MRRQPLTPSIRVAKSSDWKALHAGHLSGLVPSGLRFLLLGLRSRHLLRRPLGGLLRYLLRCFLLCRFLFGALLCASSALGCGSRLPGGFLFGAGLLACCRDGLFGGLLVTRLLRGFTRWLCASALCSRSLP